MQNYKKIILLAAGILALLGGILGYELAKSGIGINKFDWVMLPFVIIVIFSTAYDFRKISLGKKSFGTAKFKALVQTRRRLKGVFIILVVCTVFEFISFMFTRDLSGLFLGIIMLFNALMYGVHNNSDNGIGESGIFHWGVLHDWSEVGSYKFENDTLLKIQLSQKSWRSKFNNEIKLIINPAEKEDIMRFLINEIGEKM